MASEYQKTKAYERGLQGKTAVSGWNIRMADRDEIKQNETGKRDKALNDSRSKKK